MKYEHCWAIAHRDVAMSLSRFSEGPFNGVHRRARQTEGCLGWQQLGWAVRFIRNLNS